MTLGIFTKNVKVLIQFCFLLFYYLYLSCPEDIIRMNQFLAWSSFNTTVPKCMITEWTFAFCAKFLLQFRVQWSNRLCSWGFLVEVTVTADSQGLKPQNATLFRAIALWIWPIVWLCALWSTGLICLYWKFDFFFSSNFSQIWSGQIRVPWEKHSRYCVSQFCFLKSVLQLFSMQLFIQRLFESNWAKDLGLVLRKKKTLFWMFSVAWSSKDQLRCPSLTRLSDAHTHALSLHRPSHLLCCWINAAVN